MDAAYYITTLDNVAPQGGRPTTADFAIVDLAVDHDFLKYLYGGASHEAIEWWSLFEGTGWQENWSNGPILVDLRNSSAFVEQIVSRMENQPLGVLMQSSLSAPSLLQRSRQWLFSPDLSQERLLRFYEPRMLAALLCVMDNSQRINLINPGERWSWHDGLGWRSRLTTKNDATTIDASEVFVSNEQLGKIPAYRVAAESRTYADYYKNQLTEYQDPVEWVLTRLLEAREFGFSQVSSQERWLRLALRHGDAFPTSTRFREVLIQEHLSANERLLAMEGLRRTDNVSTV